MSNEIAQEPSGQVNGFAAGHATLVGQSKRDERQTPDEHANGKDGGHSNGVEHLSVLTAQAPDGHLTGTAAEQVDITGHLSAVATQVPSTGQEIVPVGHDGGVVHNANDALQDLSAHKTG